MTLDQSIPVAEALTEARRSLRARRSLYPVWVAYGRLTQEQATYRLRCMEQIVRCLEELVEAQEGGAA